MTVDLRSGAVGLILQGERHFLMADPVSGVQVVSYEVSGRWSPLLTVCDVWCVTRVGW